MWGMGKRLRENKRGVGVLAHPAVLGLVFAVIALAILAFVIPLAVVLSVGAVLVIVGAFVFGAGLRQWMWAVLGLIILIVGAVMLWLGFAVAF